MNFRASICHPFKAEISEIESIDKNKIVESFEKIPWQDLLDKMEKVDPSEIHYSPSFEVENKKNRNGITISAVDGKEWYIFFKRPKRVKKFFGLIEKDEPDYLTDVTGQSIEDAKACLNALINNDLEYLEKHIK